MLTLPRTPHTNPHQHKDTNKESLKTANLDALELGPVESTGSMIVMRAVVDRYWEGN